MLRKEGINIIIGLKLFIIYLSYTLISKNYEYLRLYSNIN